MSLRKMYVAAAIAVEIIGLVVMLWAWAINGYKPGGDPTANLIVFIFWGVGLLAAVAGYEMAEEEEEN